MILSNQERRLIDRVLGREALEVIMRDPISTPADATRDSDVEIFEALTDVQLARVARGAMIALQLLQCDFVVISERMSKVCQEQYTRSSRGAQ